MKRSKLLILLTLNMLLLTACGNYEEPYADTIQVYGVVIDSEGNPTENITIVAFLDDVEIFRSLSTPFQNRYATSSYEIACNKIPPQSNVIGSVCRNLGFSLPRVAEFNQDGSNTTINLRNIQTGETKAFRSVDGRFLVFQTFSEPPIRSLLLLLPGDTVITPLPGTVVASPTFSARPSPTAKPTATAIPSTPVANPISSSDSLWNDWIRPLIISGIIGILVTSIMYILLAKKKTNETSSSDKKDDSDVRSKKETSSPTNLSALAAAIFTGTISAVAAIIVQKILGL